MDPQKSKTQTIITTPVTRLDRWVVRIGNVIGWLFFVAVVISIFEVVMRYGFNRPTTWVHETTLMMVGVGMLWGGTYCTAEDRHIRVTVVRDAMSEKVRRIVDVVVGVFSLLFCAGLAWAGYIMTQKALFDPTGVFRLQRSGSAFNSPAPAVVKTVLFIVVILMTIQALQHLWVKVRLLGKPHSASKSGQ
jgi:TRAP-type C4-dicarboxylate transport system permease small subunit